MRYLWEKNKWSAKAVVRNKAPVMVTATVHKLRDGTMRPIPVAPSGKAQEPTLEDWQNYSAAYNITLQVKGTIPSGADCVMRVDYSGDAARALFKGRLLTDNWYTGYDAAVGGFQVGLTYLLDENKGLLPIGGGVANVTILVLPANRSALASNIFLQNHYWPAHKADVIRSVDVVCDFAQKVNIKNNIIQS